MATSKLTEAEKKAYLKNGGTCPKCKGDVNGGSVEINDNKAHQEVSCTFCDFVWIDEYTLTNILDVNGN